MSYSYLFPYDEVDKDASVIIYGCGEVGQQFVDQILRLEYCSCLSIVDENYMKMQHIAGIKVQAPSILKTCEFDKVVIASIIYADEIKKLLQDMNIPDKKIVNRIIKSEYKTKSKKISPDPQNSNMWDKYYGNAEKDAESEFATYIKPTFSKYEDINMDEVLDFACGRGRIANIFSNISKQITCCDVNAGAIDFCKERFSDSKNCKFKFVLNEIMEKSMNVLPLADREFTFIYSWDAMVHFSYKWLDFYIGEFYRISTDNAYVLMHHSNFAKSKEYLQFGGSENWHENPHGRTPVSHEDIAFIAGKHGFNVVAQKIFDWRGVPELDCISVFRKR